MQEESNIKIKDDNQIDLAVENRLSALISLYNNILNEILFYQGKGDNSEIINVVPLLIIPWLEIFGIDSIFLVILCVCIPVIQIISLQRGIQSHMFVAMLRGYAASIEENINEIIERNYYIYNSVLIDKYIASDKVVKNKGMKTSWFATALVHYVVLIISGLFCFYFNIYDIWWIYLSMVIWYMSMFVVITSLCIKFSQKEAKRYESRELSRLLRSKHIC